MWVATSSFLNVMNVIMFLSTPPVWVATDTLAVVDNLQKFLSTPPVWVATVPDWN